MPVGISLGWNCYSAMHGVDVGLRQTKYNGYKTCPFDEMVTNYEGIVQCINDGLDPLTNPEYLRVIHLPADARHNAHDDLIHHSKYKFWFNHESPGHANLYLSQNWPGGKEHYIANNYEKFRERYNRRIENLRAYCTSGDRVNFLITRFDAPMPELHDAISSTWPNLSYSIIRFDLENTGATPREAFYTQDALMKMY
jgi:hypothetical protein